MLQKVKNTNTDIWWIFQNYLQSDCTSFQWMSLNVHTNRIRCQPPSGHHGPNFQKIQNNQKNVLKLFTELLYKWDQWVSPNVHDNRILCQPPLVTMVPMYCNCNCVCICICAYIFIFICICPDICICICPDICIWGSVSGCPHVSTPIASGAKPPLVTMVRMVMICHGQRHCFCHGHHQNCTHHPGLGDNSMPESTWW